MLNRETALRALKRESEKHSLFYRGGESRQLDFLFVFEKSGGEEVALVEKMGVALRLPKNRWELAEISHLDVIDLSTVTRSVSARFIVIFGAPTGLKLQGGPELIFAPKLSEMLESPEQKRILWEKLKVGIARLGVFR